MAQCEDCMHYRVCAKEGRMVQIDEHTWDNYNQLDDVEKFCENYISTADVVPKSEVEATVEKLMSATDKVICEAKAEVAREIFEEIERFLYLHFRFCKEEIGNDDTEYVKGRMELNTQMQDFIAELKKEYTENKE